MLPKGNLPTFAACHMDAFIYILMCNKLPPKLSGLIQYLLSHIVREGREFWNSLAHWFWLTVPHETAGKK